MNEEEIKNELEEQPENNADNSHWTGPKSGQWPKVLRESGIKGHVSEELTETEEEPVIPEPAEIPNEATLQEKMEEERQYMPIRPSRERHSGCLGGIMYAAFIVCASIALACFLWMSASDVLALNKEPNEVEVTLPNSAFSDKTVDVVDENGKVTGTKTVRAANIDTVSGLLKDYGVINYKWLFKLYSGFSHADEKLDPGTYDITTNLDYRALVTKMQAGSGNQVQTLVMFPEGYNLDQIFAKLEENGVCSCENLYKAAAETEYSYAFLEGAETGDAYRLEGYLFPDTYYFYQGMQASSAINKFLSNFNNRLTEDMQQQATNLGLTLQQVLTVASMIEKEAANDSERELIASVIYNRLAAGMPLQFDSTVAYAIRDAESLIITPDVIAQTDSPYNTYQHTGLPAGPICNPGMKSIQAALNPAHTDYYYFALNMETNAMEFFIHAEEHAAFVETQDYGG